MTFRQKILKLAYPLLMWWTRKNKKRTANISNEKKAPAVSFYSLKSILGNGDSYSFNILKGKKVLVVNTASDCGYTDQYAELQKLYEQNKERLEILAFPANDFKEQEKGTDEEIAQFCKLNYGVSFPLMKKSVVKKGDEQNEVFKWLSDSSLNGWNDKQPGWNFSKYLVNGNGVLTNYFGPSLSPLSEEILQALKEG